MNAFTLSRTASLLRVFSLGIAMLVVFVARSQTPVLDLDFGDALMGGACGTGCAPPPEQSPEGSQTQGTPPPGGTVTTGTLPSGSPLACSAPGPELPGPGWPLPAADVGLARWRISEPAVNVWLLDTPMHYPVSRGRTVRFRLFYKNRQGVQGSNDTSQVAVFGFGQRWHSPWRAYVEAVSSEPTNYWVYPGIGNATKFTLDQPDYLTRARLVQSSSTNILQFPDGESWTFGLAFTNGDVVRYFITQKSDPHGDGLRFEYLVTNNTIRLQQILDVDNRSIAFEYVTAGGYSNLVSKVIAPHGLTNVLQYDSSGRLTNITDTVGLSSRMSYDATNLTALITPYGTNSFAYFGSSDQMYAVKVTENDVRNHLYLYHAEVEGGKMTNNLAAYLPSTTNAGSFAISNTLDYLDGHKRNSFHWGPRQYENLSDNVRTNLALSLFNVSNLTSADYVKARLTHWLQSAGTTNVGITPSFKRDASADGTTPGQISWFDYVQKNGGAPDQEGAAFRRRLVATKLPNGEARFSYMERNELGHTTLTAETYTPPSGGCQLRTNLFEYATNGVDLIKHTRLVGGGSKLVSSNSFNGAHRILTNINAAGETTVRSYNSKQQLSTVQYPGGLMASNTYEASGNWSNFLARRVKAAIGYTNSFTYSNGYVFGFTDAKGLSTTRTRDSLGRKLSTLYPDGTSSTRRYENLHLAERVDRLGATNRFSYNAFRQRTQQVDPRGNTNVYTYCVCGSLDSVMDALGNTTQFVYDQKGRRCVNLLPGGYSVTNNYDLLGRVTNVTDSAGVGVTNWFNNQGQLCIVSNAFGCRQLTKYDLEGHVIETMDANSVTNYFAYDELGRRTFFTNGLGGVVSFTYSTLGLVAQTNEMGNYTCFSYDSAGRKIAETNANGEVTQFQYDSAGNLTNLIDPKGNITSWKYDEFGRATNKIDALGTVIFACSYDANGRLTNRYTPAKGNTRYSYDASGNLTNIDYPNSPDISLQYDASGRLTNMVDAVGTTRYTYAESGDLLSEDGPWSDDTVSYSYTSNWLRSGMTLLQPNAAAWVQDYAYDGASRLTSITSPAGTFSYTYDPARNMRIRRLLHPSGSYITNTYDAQGRLTGTYLKNNAGTVLNLHEYAYDAAHRATNQMRLSGDSVAYTYDDSGQLKTATAKESGGADRVHERFNYAYDAAGNLNHRTNNAFAQTFSVDSLNRLSTINRSGTLTVAGYTTADATNVTVNANSGGAVSALRYADRSFARTNVTLLDGTNTFVAAAQDSLGRESSDTINTYLPSTNTFSHDSNGNMLSDGRRHFTWDDENQLIVVVVTNATKSEFSYDGKLRRRVRKEYLWSSAIGNWQSTTETRYVYDGNLVIQERHFDSQLSTTHPQRFVTYARGLDLSGTFQGAGGIGGLLARTESTVSDVQSAFYYSDKVGNVTAIVDANQQVVARYVYEPFGRIFAMSGALAEANLYRFSSKEAHEQSRLVYYLYRFYDQNLQRWLNPDPITDAGFASLAKEQVASIVQRLAKLDPVIDTTFTSFTKGEDRMNPYRFVCNKAGNAIDPFGLRSAIFQQVGPCGPLNQLACLNTCRSIRGLVGVCTLHIVIFNAPPIMESFMLCHCCHLRAGPLPPLR